MLISRLILHTSFKYHISGCTICVNSLCNIIFFCWIYWKCIPVILLKLVYYCTIKRHWNTFPKHLFELCRRFVHLVDNTASRPKKCTENYDPIFKCRKLMERIMNIMTILWIAGVRVSIDEIMILYTYRAITFGQ